MIFNNSIIIVILILVSVTGDAYAENDSIRVRGQLNVVDYDEPIGSGDGEDFQEKLFDQLASLRIAREYLRQKIAAERRQPLPNKRS